VLLFEEHPLDKSRSFRSDQGTPLTPSSAARCCRHHLNWPTLLRLLESGNAPHA